MFPPLPSIQTVRIPACDEHDGHALTRVALLWTCPVCGGPRGEIVPAISFDGSRRLACDGWANPCGHVDTYANVRREGVPVPPAPPDPPRPLDVSPERQD